MLVYNHSVPIIIIIANHLFKMRFYLLAIVFFLYVALCHNQFH